MEQLANKNGSHKILSISGGPLPLVFPPNEKRSHRFCVFDPKDGQVFSLPIDSIVEPCELSRPVINDEAQLSLIESIREYGLINPITVCFDKDAFYLIAGRARLHAAKSAGKTMIPCMIKTGDPQLLSLIENLHRKSLTPIQEAEACKNLQRRLGLSQKTLAEKLKKSTTNMNDILRLNALPDEIKTVCRDDNRHSRRFFLDLLKQPPHEMMIALKAAADNTAPKSALEDPSVKQIETKNKPSHERQSRQKVLAKKLQSLIAAAAKLASSEVSAEERNEIRRLYELLGKLI